MSDDASPIPSLEVYATASAHVVGETEPEAIYAALAERGFDRARWDRIDAHWRQRLTDPALAARYFELLKEALAAECGALPELSVDDYVDATAKAYSGVPTATIAGELGMSVKAFTLLGYRWMDRMAAEPRLDTEVKLRMQRALADRTGEAPKEQLRWNPGTMVRKRSCIRCGAPKVTPPRTAYIHCDYCGALFDVDPMVAAQDAGALDPDTVSGALEAVTEADLVRAFRDDDRETYAALVRWKTEVAMAVSPETHSPRVGDPTYRRRLAEVTAEWAVVTRWDADFVKAVVDLERAEQACLEDLGAEALLDYLERSQAVWRQELELAREAGILERHPDQLDEGLFLHIRGSQFCRRWLPFLNDGDDIDALLERAGVKAQYVEAPMRDLANLTCGQCESKVLAPADARRKVCEACGHVLDLEARVVPCTSCGAGVSLAAGQTERTEYHCAFCDARWSL